MKIVVTGAGGLLGWHAAARLHARNCAARFRGEAEPITLVQAGRAEFSDPSRLARVLAETDAVLHFAGINRGPAEEVEAGNPAIADTLIAGCRAANVTPHIVYANSKHANTDTPYGNSKRRAGEALSAFAPRFTDLILPHIFGECARPYYNNVTATLIDQIINGDSPSVNPDGKVHLLHAGAAAQTAIDAALNRHTGQIVPPSLPLGIPELLQRLQDFHRSYQFNVYPCLSDDFELAMFNTYRSSLYPNGFPWPLKLNNDHRGTLFEAVRGGGGGQTFLSWTEPGVTRGDHFHLDKVERFLVLEGEATIRIRRALDETVWEYPVSGANPAYVDIPTLHTHSIENTGPRPLLTLFWAHEIFDPTAPDTYADPVLST